MTHPAGDSSLGPEVEAGCGSGSLEGSWRMQGAGRGHMGVGETPPPAGDKRSIYYHHYLFNAQIIPDLSSGTPFKLGSLSF